MSMTIRKLIAEIGGEKVKIASRIGVSGARLYEYETGRRPIPDHQLVHLATLAGVDPRLALGDYAYERLLGKTPGRLARMIGGALLLIGLNTAPTTSEASPGAHNVQRGKRRWGLQEGSGLASMFCPRCSPRGLISC